MTANALPWQGQNPACQFGGLRIAPDGRDAGALTLPPETSFYLERGGA